MINVNVCNKLPPYLAEIIGSDDLYQSFGKLFKNLNEKEKKKCLEILKSEFIVGYKLNREIFNL